ncbi:hypothetical protein [Roseospira navarrensis]|uniref:Uncharacterized protein n=1 Tax=Roseospira navarrensis TaxID=140058 RepID=A0A7X2D3L1_9PROT|nr:hypothetical protein [Roseospira navarrensis]MQX37524.1 hypothetical protein [Roseospira navarrensis]
MHSPDNDIPDWDKTFTARWQAAIKREFGSGNVAAHKLSREGINPTTVKSWFKNGGRPTVANLCLVARAARDPSAFMVEVCGDEPWARELGVAVQRRRLASAELSFMAARAPVQTDPGVVIRALTGPVRRYRLVTETGQVSPSADCPEEAALSFVDLDSALRTPAVDHVLRTRGWVLIEEEDGDDQPLIVRCDALSVAAGACEALIDVLERELPRAGAVLRVFITDWVDFPCANLYQLATELERIRQIQAFCSAADAGASQTVRFDGMSPGSERRSLDEIPQSGRAFMRIWKESGGIVDSDLIQRVEQSALFDMGGVFGVQDQRFRVAYVGPKLRLPVGMTRERITGHDLLEIQPSSGFGAMVASHYALAARERAPVVHLVRVTRQRSYRRVSYPIFDPRGRKVVAIIGFSDARNTEVSNDSAHT